ncbi:hypothetical protein HELRODRAFT_194632 [Helobdella robusta]|uniref:Poly [ADP-ribose] polymerase n=1 Tax=Helobdella robusta TaxID=6412 RepID=T1FW90_HELRO|nr:hypothetical protein HELRODRAFT_194632 [Helobdella robusta]ESN90841.1 hypothetical protein HELRODRAFT_194632 [Helobdella robusta]
MAEELGSIEVLFNEANSKLFNIILTKDKDRLARDLEICFDENKEVLFEFVSDNKYKITIHYNKSRSKYEDDDDLKTRLLNYTSTWKSCSSTPSQNKILFLKSTIGESYIRKFNSEPIIIGSDVKVRKDGGDVDCGVGVKTFACLILHEESYTLAVVHKNSYNSFKSKLNNDIHEEHVKLVDENAKKLIECEKLKSLARGFEEKVYMTVSSDEIVLVGDVSNVTNLKHKLENFFENESNSIEEIQITRGQYLLLSKDYDRILPENIELTLAEDCITLKGTKFQLQNAEKIIKENFIQKYKSHSFDVYERGLKVDSFDKDNGPAYDHIALIESRYKCAFEIAGKKVDQPDIDGFSTLFGSDQPVSSGDDNDDHKEEDDDEDDEGDEKDDDYDDAYDDDNDDDGDDDEDDEGDDDEKDVGVNIASQSSPTSFQPVIKVLNGSIVECKNSDILVNVLCEKNPVNLSNSRSGVICRSFHSALGSQLYDDLKAQGFPTEFGSEPAITDALKYKTVDCKWLYHIYMERFKGTEQYNSLKGCILKCLENAKAQNCKNIAFPTLGCGKLNYSAREVCTAFVEAAKEFKYPIEIKILTTCAKTENVFKETLTKKNALTSNSKKSHKSSKSCPRRDEMMIEFTIHTLFAEDSIKIKDIENAVRAKLKSICGCLSIEHDVFSCLGELSQFFKSKLAQLTSAADIQNGQLTIYGLSSELVKLKTEVQRLCDWESRRLNDLDNFKKTKGPKAYYLKVVKLGSIIYPSYFKCSDKADLSETKIPLNKNGRRYKAISEMVLQTWDAKLVGKGADAIGLGHKQISIKHIYLNENLNFYKHYWTAKKGHMEKFQHSDKPYPDLSVNKPKTCDFGPYLNGLLDKELNEVYLFHGTKEKSVKVILHSGIDSRFSSDKALFGSGAYFAESSTKADQYADDKKARKAAGTPMFMFLSRVLLGSAYVCTSAHNFKKPPCTHQTCSLLDNCATHPFHDSVIGTHKQPDDQLLFKEYVIYEKNNSYPEFLIEYVRE